MNAQVNRDFATPAAGVRALVAEFGTVRVALALAGLVARRRVRAARVWEDDMPDRMRRDIGLEPLPRLRNYWDL
ncbi:hypothetical protein [Albidovulum sp.]|uniref:hypothetical protein n=1 Tax=Albidovulum sp. TaxID=1872424 RepID=UPI0039B8F6DF